MTVRKILCVLDENKSLSQILEYAVYLAWSQWSKLFLLYLGESERRLSQPTRHKIEKKLESDAMACLSSYVIDTEKCMEIEIEVSGGNQIAEILKKATQENVDLIVIDHKIKAEEPVSTNRFVEKVFRAAPCPVLINKPKLTKNDGLCESISAKMLTQDSKEFKRFQQRSG